MDWGFFTKKSLGIDIGASSIKIVEVVSVGKKKRLENYAEFRFPEKPSSFQAFDPETLLLLSDEVAEILKSILEKINIKEKKAAFSIPDFSTFFTTFNLPAMTEAEIPQAVQFEARHHIPLPLSEVTFDWKIISKKENIPGSKISVLLVAVPNKVLASYQRLAAICQLEVVGMEAEVFGLSRVAIPEDKKQATICLVDFGWQSTTVSIIDEGNLKVSHSFDVSGVSLTNTLSRELKMSKEEAEKLKRSSGLNPEKREVYNILNEQIGSLALEIEKMLTEFKEINNKETESIVLSGGTAKLPGLSEFFRNNFKKTVSSVDPFSGFAYPAVLEERLREIGPSFAVALGVGLMGAEG